MGLSALLELLTGVLVDGLEHHEARLSPCTFFLSKEALVNERLYPVQGLHREVTLRVADRLYCLEGTTPREHREPGKERHLALVEQRVAPLHRGPQGPL